jgi:hypothetical protein
VDEQGENTIEGDAVMKRNMPQPNRPLSVNFTDSTLRQAIKTKRRYDYRLIIKELFQMKRNKLTKPAGALLALALVVLGGAAVYAATNWFKGNVTVTSDNSIMTVDLSECESNLPPGVEPKSDRSNIQFKITGTPHISPEELERKLLVRCEFDSVSKFYQSKFGASVGTPSAVVRSVDTTQKTVSFDVKWGDRGYAKTFKLASGFIVMDKGMPGSLSSLKEGDHVIFAYKLPESLIVAENQDPLDQVTEVLGAFKTQYDTRELLKDGKSLYSANNIMPLDWYNQIHK